MISACLNVSSKKKFGFHVSLGYRRPHFGLLNGTLKVAYGNDASFATYPMMFLLMLPS